MSIFLKFLYQKVCKIEIIIYEYLKKIALVSHSNYSLRNKVLLINEN